MDVFGIHRLAILILFLQTTSASGTTEVIGAVGRSVTFHSRNPDRNMALWSFGNDPIVSVIFKDPPRVIFFEDRFKTRFAVSENGHALSISELSMEDAGTYSLNINGKISTFTLQVFKELAEPTVTCEAQNCSDGTCSSSLRCSAPGAGFGNVSYTWRLRDHTWDRSSVVLLVNETSQEELGLLLTCTARNPVSNRSVIVTNFRVLCAGESRGQAGKGGVG
ncbi:LY9 protein, partial [Passerina amoena]|nr:LY9 protein [Passerina amoena]